MSRRVYPIIFATLVVFASVFSLTATYSFTKEKIEEQKMERLKELLITLFPEMTDYRYHEKGDIYEILKDGKRIGYAFLAKGKGYGGEIDILVGLKNETTVKGIVIISQRETPGLGTKITERWFTDRFNNKNIGDIELKKNGGKIERITGATISSTAVVKAVRESAEKKVEVIKKMEGSE